MKLYYIYLKSNKDIVYKSIEKEDVINTFKEENLNKKYYEMAEFDSPFVEEYAKGIIGFNELKKFIEV